MILPAVHDESFEAVARRLLLLRIAKGYGGRRQKAFADFVGLGITQYNNYEAGRLLPPIATGLMLARKTGLTLDWLYRGIEDLMPIHLVRRIAVVTEDEVAESKRA